MARVNSRSSFFPCSETKQRSLLRRLMRRKIYNYFFFFGWWAILSVSSQIMTIGISYGHYMWWLFFIGLPIRATFNQEIPLVHVEKRPNGGRNFQKTVHVPFPLGPIFRGGDASFQVVWRTDLEVDLENEHKIILCSYWPYICAELLCKYSIRWGN